VDLFAVMGEIGTAVDQIAGLRVKAWDAQTTTPPAALVTLPASMNYHGTYGVGQQDIKDLTVVVLVGKASDRVAFKRICEYVKPAGATSVRAKIEGYTYTTCDAVTVTSVNFAPAQELDGTDYLAAVFHLDITGPAT
jgi:hypothetical protein